MSESVELTRTPRASRQRQAPVDDAEEPIRIIETAPQGPSPEEHAERTQAILRQQTEELERQKQARQAAEQEAAQLRSARAEDARTVVASGVEEATNAKSAAIMMLRQAREAGDLDAEIKATEALSSATYRLNVAEGQLAQLGKPGQPAPQQQAPAQQPQRQRSPETQKWLADHPRYNSDGDYRAIVHGLHGEAISQHPEGSQAYINFIENRLNNFLGEGHGDLDAPQHQQAAPRQRQQPMSDAMPPGNRGGGAGRSGGYKTAEINLGQNGRMAQVEYKVDQYGNIEGIRFKDGRDIENFAEGGRIGNPQLYKKDPNEATYWFAKESIQAYREGNPDVKIGDGAKYE